MSEIKIYALVKTKRGIEKRAVDPKMLDKMKAKHPIMPAAYDKFKKHGAIWTPR